MVVLTIRTDKPEAEIGLFDNKKQLAYLTWQGHRQLAETIHQKIRDMLSNQGKVWSDVEAVVCFKGPGSFTGLRIGLTVANALAYSLQVPIVGASGEQWIEHGIKNIIAGEDDQQLLPEYGAEAHITVPKS